MDIPTYDSFIERHDAKGQNIVTKLVMHVPGTNRIQINSDISNGDIDANKLDFTTLNTLIAKSPSGFSQDIAVAATLTDITNAKISAKSSRKSLIMCQAVVGFKLNGAGATANVTIGLVVDGILRNSKVFDFGSTDTSGVGLQSTRSINDLLMLPIGRHTVKLQAKFDTLSNVPTLHISSFYLVYIPLGN